MSTLKLHTHYNWHYIFSPTPASTFPAQYRHEMRSLHTHSPLTLIIIFFFLFSSSLATTTGECKPVTWQAEDDLRPATAITKAPFPRFTPSVPRKRPVEPGDINCRYDANTYKDVSCCTCKILAHRYGITIEKFFMLNPELAPYCSNIKPYTTYCVAGCKLQYEGYIEKH